MKVTTVGLDLAKNVFQVHGTDEHGARVFNRQLRRSQMVEFFTRLSPCTVGMEACASAHHWARTLQGLGHRVKLIPAQYVKAYLRGQKNDMRDAAAIAEATRCPTMSQVALKTEAQQAVFALHRQRALLMKMRTAQANQLRSLLAEFGLILPLGVQRLQRELPMWLDVQRLPEPLVTVLRTGLVMLNQLGDQLLVLDRAIAAEHSRSALSQRLAHIAGIGVLSATALAAQLGNAQGLCPLTRLLGQSGTHPAPTLQRRAESAGIHHQARRPVSAHPAHPRCPCSDPRAQTQASLWSRTGSHRAVGCTVARASTPQQGLHRLGSQKCPHRMGPGGASTRVSAPGSTRAPEHRGLSEPTQSTLTQP